MLKIYSEFFFSTKKLQELKEFYNFMDTEFVSLIRNVKTTFFFYCT